MDRCIDTSYEEFRRANQLIDGEPQAICEVKAASNKIASISRDHAPLLGPKRVLGQGLPRVTRDLMITTGYGGDLMHPLVAATITIPCCARS